MTKLTVAFRNFANAPKNCKPSLFLHVTRYCSFHLPVPLCWGMKLNTLMELNCAKFIHKNNMLLVYVTKLDTFRPTFDGH
jgi:hypothetical protein